LIEGMEEEEEAEQTIHV
jgi:hypothetical protein